MTKVVIVGLTSCFGWRAIRQECSEVLCLCKGVDTGIKTSEFIRRELIDDCVIWRSADSSRCLDVGGGDDREWHVVAGKIGEASHRG